MAAAGLEAFGSAAAAGKEGATPWPEAKKGGKGAKKKFVHNVLDSPPPRAAEVLKPIEGDSGTKKEEETVDTKEKDSLEKDLAEIVDIEMGKSQQAMDMTITDNDGDMDEDTSVGMTIVKEKDRVTRRQRPQDADVNGKGSQERSRSRPQIGPNMQLQKKKTLKGARSETLDTDP